MKLHLGCGKRDFGEGWVNIDRADFPHVHYHDITELPFDNCSVEYIYASHVLEYFDQFEVIEVLKEWHRVLKPGGVLRVAVPDFTQVVTLYNQDYPLNTFLGLLYGRMKSGEDMIYHRMVYDYTTLRNFLMNAGFHYILPYDWRDTEHAMHDDHSQAYLPHMDKDNGTLMSLNVECKKCTE
jgi:predicted SAM-dependent methyltransferase